MPLKNENGGEPIAVISIDFMTLAFGPVHHAIRFKKNGGRNYVGLLQYNIQFEQICESQIFIKNINVNLHSIEDQPVCTNFRCITPETKLESSWSFSKIGKYNTKENQTSIAFNFRVKKDSEPKLVFTTTMENLIDSSIQICLWKDNRGMRKQEKIKTIITKNLSAGVNIDDVNVSLSDEDGSEVSDSEFQSAFDSQNRGKHL